MKKKILIVDDDRLNIATLGRGLEKAGYEAITTLSGEEAIKICAERSPDLAILDVRMANIDGLDVAHSIREQTEVPLIFLSASSDKAMVEKAVEEGTLGYLVEPVDIPQLVPAVEVALARAKDLRELRKKESNWHAGLLESRAISVAVGLQMERYNISEETAFNVLRAEARHQRRKVFDLASDIVQATNTLALLHDRVSKFKAENSE